MVNRHNMTPFALPQSHAISVPMLHNKGHWRYRVSE